MIKINTIQKDLECKQAIFGDMHAEIAEIMCDLCYIEYVMLIDSNEAVSRHFATLTEMVDSIVVATGMTHAQYFLCEFLSCNGDGKLLFMLHSKHIKLWFPDISTLEQEKKQLESFQL